MRWIGPVLLLCVSASADADAPRPVSRPGIAAIVTDARLGELSGLARSNYVRDRYWAINDGGNGNRLLLIDGRGHVLRSYEVPGAENVDWEDIASFEWRKRKRLVIADTGDNSGVRHDARLLLLDEPDPGAAQAALTPPVRITLRYPDAPHDVEAMTVDTSTEDVLLLTKRTVPPVLFRLPLDSFDRPDTAAVPQKVVELNGVPQPSEREIARDGALSRYRSQTTAMKLDCSGRGLLVLTYDAIYRYERAEAQSWELALSGQNPGRSSISLLPQAEAMELDWGCENLFVGSEKAPVPLLRFRYRPLPASKAPGR